MMASTVGRWVRRFGIVFALVWCAESALAQTDFVPSRTPDGAPDFQGVWEARWMTPLERPAGITQLSVDQPTALKLEAEIKAFFLSFPAGNPESDFDWSGLAPISGGYRTSLIVDPPDGRLPIRPESLARVRMQMRPLDQADNHEERHPFERCVFTPAIPLFGGYIQIVQPRGQFVVGMELGDWRNLSPGRWSDLGTQVRGRLGDYASRWEGDTLTVETRGVEPELRFMPPMTLYGLRPQARITETFTMISSDEIIYRFTVDDPDFYTQPWTAETIFVRSSRLYEYACHEGNHAVINVMGAARVGDRLATAPGPQDLLSDPK